MLPGRVVWPVVAVLWLVVACRSGAFGAAPRGPDNPADRYWFRGTAPVTEQGVMDPRVRAIGDAFGAGRYEECRRLAEQLLEEARTSELRDQAAAYVIESSLAQGEFQGARDAIQRLAVVAPDTCRETGQRLDELEEAYRVYMEGRQGVLETAKSSAEEARLDLLIGRADEIVGRLRPAEDSYAKAVRWYRRAAEARRAAAQLAELRLRQGRWEDACGLYEAVIQVNPDDEAALSASLSAFPVAALSGEGNEVAARARLLRIAESLPGTAASLGARCGLAGLAVLHSLGQEVSDLVLDLRRPDSSLPPAERVQALCWLAATCRDLGRLDLASACYEAAAGIGSPGPLGGKVGGLLASARYAQAMQLYAKGQFVEAAADLEEVLKGDLPPEADRFLVTQAIGLCYLATGQVGRGVPWLEGAYAQDAERARARGIAYQVGRCYFELGKPIQAKEWFEKAVSDDPDGPAAVPARDYLRRCDEASGAGATTADR